MKILSLSVAMIFLTSVQGFAGEAATVLHAIDGNALELSDGKQVSLIGVTCASLTDKEQNAKIARELRVDLDLYESYAEKASRFLVSTFAEQLGGDARASLFAFKGKDIWLEREGKSSAYAFLYETWYLTDPKPWEPGSSYEPVFYRAPTSEKLGNVLVMLNGELIEQGYCAVDRQTDFKHKDKFLALEEKARDSHQGMWR